MIGSWVFIVIANTSSEPIGGLTAETVRGVYIFASKLIFKFWLVFHWLVVAVRIMYRIRPVLSWKYRCRSPLGRIAAAKDVSLRIYCVVDILIAVLLGVDIDGGLGVDGLGSNRSENLVIRNSKLIGDYTWSQTSLFFEYAKLQPRYRLRLLQQPRV